MPPFPFVFVEGSTRTVRQVEYPKLPESLAKALKWRDAKRGRDVVVQGLDRNKSLEQMALWLVCKWAKEEAIVS